VPRAKPKKALVAVIISSSLKQCEDPAKNPRYTKPAIDKRPGPRDCCWVASAPPFKEARMNNVVRNYS
jgi:hypothetical protein